MCAARKTDSLPFMALLSGGVKMSRVIATNAAREENRQPFDLTEHHRGAVLGENGITFRSKVV